MSTRRRGSGRQLDLEAAVLALLEQAPTRSFKLKELQRALGVGHSRYRQLRSVVTDLVRAGRVSALPRRRYGSMQTARFLEGRIEGVGQRASHVLLKDESRIGLVPSAVQHCVPGDEVRIRRVRDGREILAQIDRVTKAAPRHVFGVLQRVGNNWVLIPENPVPGLAGGSFVDSERARLLEPDLDGSLAQGWLPAFDPATERPRLSELEILGAEDHPQAAMSLRIARAGWPRQFGPEAEVEAAAEPERWQKRRSLVDDLVFTIDPLDAKDHDDAISIERARNGGFVLSIHIADVAAAVIEDTALDREALERATSVYPPGRVLPMLPHALSSGACSLHHGVERDTVSVRLHYDSQGERGRVELGLARIRSRASLAYEHAEQLVDDTEFRPPPERIDDGCECSELRASLKNMFDLAQKLRDRRRVLGSLFVQRPEREFRFREDGHVDEVHIRKPLRAHWVIEEFMLEANRAVAAVLQRADLPLLWRVHESPDEQKVSDLSEFLGHFGVRWIPEEPVSGHDYAELFRLVEGMDEAPQFHLLALRSLMKARYHAGWGRHFGLAFEQYTHFTSPIRRYPDLYNQRWLHKLVNSGGDEGWLEDALAQSKRLSAARLARPADYVHAKDLADHCSELERQAQRIERDCADICAADAMKPREGEELEGRIVSVLASGLFVEIEDSGLDGFVGVEQLRDDWYNLDPKRHTLVGERTGRRFRLGQRVRVLLEYVDVTNGRTWLGDLRAIPTSRTRRARGSGPESEEER